MCNLCIIENQKVTLIPDNANNCIFLIFVCFCSKMVALKYIHIQNRNKQKINLTDDFFLMLIYLFDDNIYYRLEVNI